MIDLTPSEEAIVKLLIRGYTCVQASEKRGVHHKTGQKHMENARHKNECSTALQLAVEYALWKAKQASEAPAPILASSRTVTPSEWTHVNTAKSWRESYKVAK